MKVLNFNLENECIHSFNNMNGTSILGKVSGSARASDTSLDGTSVVPVHAPLTVPMKSSAFTNS